MIKEKCATCQHVYLSVTKSPCRECVDDIDVKIQWQWYEFSLEDVPKILAEMIRIQSQFEDCHSVELVINQAIMNVVK